MYAEQSQKQQYYQQTIQRLCHSIELVVVVFCSLWFGLVSQVHYKTVAIYCCLCWIYCRCSELIVCLVSSEMPSKNNNNSNYKTESCCWFLSRFGVYFKRKFPCEISTLIHTTCIYDKQWTVMYSMRECAHDVDKYWNRSSRNDHSLYLIIVCAVGQRRWQIMRGRVEDL